MKLSLTWLAEEVPQLFFIIGDVRDVLNSNATNLHRVPQGLSHGFGALTRGVPELTGEALIVRSRASLTPPTPEAGILIDYPDSETALYTPFFLGWKGSPLAQGQFEASVGVTLLDLYRALFQQLRESSSQASNSMLVCAEILAEFPIEQIFDRALQLPVHEGNRLITSPENADDYFLYRIIQREEKSMWGEDGHSLVLAVTGAGFSRAIAPNMAFLDSIESRLFYTPPGAVKQATSKVKTHSHAMGWRSSDVSLLPSDDRWLENALLSVPDYTVHIDEWSRTTRGFIKVYAATSEEQLLGL